jgi:hypothetical protein
MNIEVNQEEICDLTGEKIERKEPRIVINNLCFHLESELDTFEESSIDVSLLRSGIRCDLCKDSENLSYRLETDNKYTVICNECKNKAEEFIDNMSHDKLENIYHYSNSGFCIGNPTDECKDIIDGTFIRGDEAVIEIGAKKRFRCKISNIDELIKCFKNPEESKHSRKTETGKNCLSCGEYIGIENIAIKRKYHFHLECCEELAEELKEFRDENMDVIMSESI